MKETSQRSDVMSITSSIIDPGMLEKAKEIVRDRSIGDNNPRSNNYRMPII